MLVSEVADATPCPFLRVKCREKRFMMASTHRFAVMSYPLLEDQGFAQRISSGDILVEDGIHGDLEHHFASSLRRSRLLSLCHSSLMHECSPLHVHVRDVDG